MKEDSFDGQWTHHVNLPKLSITPTKPPQFIDCILLYETVYDSKAAYRESTFVKAVSSLFHV